MVKRLLIISWGLLVPLSQIAHAESAQDKAKRERRAQETQRAQAAAQARRAAIIQTRRNFTPQRTQVRCEADLNRSHVSLPNVAPREFSHSPQHINRSSFAAAQTHVIRQRHDRIWWVNHFPHTRFVLFGEGYYYWWNGYWYPAYGYDPSYSNYIYNAPISGYNDYAPGEVIENVQTALREKGYYFGPIDGLVGPQTRAALARYQSDRGLAVTSAIDQPTLLTLGLG